MDKPTAQLWKSALTLMVATAASVLLIGGWTRSGIVVSLLRTTGSSPLDMEMNQVSYFGFFENRYFYDPCFGKIPLKS